MTWGFTTRAFFKVVRGDFSPAKLSHSRAVVLSQGLPPLPQKSI